MATKKKIKAKASATKKKAVAKPKAKNASTKKKAVATKSKAVVKKAGKASVKAKAPLASKKTSGKAKAPVVPKKIASKAKIAPKKVITKSKAGSNNKKAVKKPMMTEPLHTGPDLHLIPVKGEIHPVRINEKGLIENAFHHNEEVALHQEQQRVKTVMANRNKKVLFRPRQS